MDIDGNFGFFLAICLYLLSFYFLFKGVARGVVGTIIVFFVILFTVVFSLLTGSYFVANWFTGIGFDDSIFYHLRFGVEGAGFGDFYFLIFYFILIQIIFLFAIILYLRKFIRSDISCIRVVPVVQAGLMIFSAFFCTPATSNLISYLFTTQIIDDYPEYSIKPHIAASTAHPKNIIYFYLESLERNYLDESLFPGLLPELQKIEKESVTFSRVGQTIGGSWTMAGMVSSQCGLPLLSAFTNNNFHMDRFMPNAVCLGDILRSHNYHLEFMGGAEMDFAGKGLFYKNHGFVSVKGKKEFIAEDGWQENVNNWGLYDDTLYEKLLQRVKQLRHTKMPWGIFSINIGTHQPEGYLAPQCKKVKYGDGSDNLLNAARCTDMLVGNLYRELKKEGVLNDTLVVFASDHLAPVMVKPYQTLKKAERYNLFMIAGAGLTPSVNSRHGMTFDIASTLLSYLQFGSHPVSLGRDLNGNLPTLAEKFPSQESLDGKLIAWRTAIDMAFWGYPEFKGTLGFDVDHKLIEIGDKTVTYPSLIRYSPSGKISEIVYGGDNPIAEGDNRFLPAFYLVNFFSNNQLFMWVDRCRELSTLDIKLQKFGDNYCFYNGTLAATRFSSGPISANNNTLKIISDNDAAPSFSQASELRKELSTKNLISWERTLIKSEKTSSFPISAVMAAGNNSLVRPTNIAGTPVTKSGVFLSVLSYKNDREAGLSYHVDMITKLSICEKKKPSLSLSELLKKSAVYTESTPLFYAIAGNIDEECKGGVINPLRDLPLAGLERLSMGSAYVAIVDDKLNVKYEKSGSADQSLGVKIMFNEEQ